MTTVDRKFIPIAKPLIGEAEKRAVMEVLDSGQLAMGSRTEALCPHRWYSRHYGNLSCRFPRRTYCSESPVSWSPLASARCCDNGS